MIDLDCDMSVEPRSEELRRPREEKETNNNLKKTTNLWFVLLMESLFGLNIWFLFIYPPATTYKLVPNNGLLTC